MRYDREYRRARYDHDYGRPSYDDAFTHNPRLGYWTRYGEGTESSPYRGGGSVGRGYGRAADLGFDRPYRGAWDVREVEYGRRRQGGREDRLGRDDRRRARERREGRRPGTAARARDRAYPYFGSAAAFEAASGYPPGESLNPEIPRHWRGPDPSYYDDEY